MYRQQELVYRQKELVEAGRDIRSLIAESSKENEEEVKDEIDEVIGEEEEVLGEEDLEIELGEDANQGFAFRFCGGYKFRSVQLTSLLRRYSRSATHMRNLRRCNESAEECYI